jgi:hypothetical protein
MVDMYKIILTKQQVYKWLLWERIYEPIYNEGDGEHRSEGRNWRWMAIDEHWPCRAELLL